MEPRISLVTLAVADIDTAAAFYDALGWQRASVPETADIVAYDLLGQSLALYPREMLARDMGILPEALGTGGITLAHNVGSPSAVDSLMACAHAAGARILAAASTAHWGGRVGYFADPDGHVWEIAHNPGAPLGPEGAFRWLGYRTA